MPEFEPASDLGSNGGLTGSIRRMMDSVLALAQNRFELFAVELQEEKIRAVELLLLAAAAIVLGILTLVAATATVVVLLWDSSPVLVLGIITLGYALGAALIIRKLREKLSAAVPPFSGTVEEFKKDREWLRGKN